MITTKRKIKILEMCIKTLECYDFFGLCAIGVFLHSKNKIKDSELIWLENLIDIHPPRHAYDVFYYWKPGSEKPRLRWLNKRIKELKGRIKT